MWINVGFSFGFIKMILLIIFLATSVYLFFDWSYVRESFHENIDAGSSNVKKSLNSLGSKEESNTDKSSGDDFLKKHKEDFFK
jgi:hypothetical protein